MSDAPDLAPALMAVLGHHTAGQAQLAGKNLFQRVVACDAPPDIANDPAEIATPAEETIAIVLVSLDPEEPVHPRLFAIDCNNLGISTKEQFRERAVCAEADDYVEQVCAGFGASSGVGFSTAVPSVGVVRRGALRN